MTHTSAIRNPSKARFIQVHAWQRAFCQQKNNAAVVLSHFIGWHDWKVKEYPEYAAAYNAEGRLEGHESNKHAYLYFTMGELIEGCMGLYGKTAIKEALDFLYELKVIGIDKNPNPRYSFDKTKYFKFYPQVCNQWLAENFSAEQDKNNTQVVENFAGPKVADHLSKKSEPPVEKSRPLSKRSKPSGESSQAITETTNKTTTHTKLINLRASENLPTKPQPSQAICKTSTSPASAASSNISTTPAPVADPTIITTQPITKALIAKGMGRKRFTEDAIATIDRLQQLGASTEVFLRAYEKAMLVTKNFGVRYLAPIVEQLLAPPKTRTATQRASPDSPRKGPDHFSETVYESDYGDSANW